MRCFFRPPFVGKMSGYSHISVKERVHCFSMQIVINKCFFLNPERKKLAQIRLVVFEKNAKKRTL